MSILKDHAYEAFGLRTEQVPQDILVSRCQENLQFHTQGNAQAQQRLLQVVDQADIESLSAGDENSHRLALWTMIYQTQATNAAKNATVALIAAKADVLKQCITEFPSPAPHSNMFANHDNWPENLKIVEQVLQNNRMRSLFAPDQSILIAAPRTLQ